MLLALCNAVESLPAEPTEPSAAVGVAQVTCWWLLFLRLFRPVPCPLLMTIVAPVSRVFQACACACLVRCNGVDRLTWHSTAVALPITALFAAVRLPTTDAG